ncbi:hypothetical protein Q5752_004392 [Cryptotrichosporon argae]
MSAHSTDDKNDSPDLALGAGGSSDEQQETEIRLEDYLFDEAEERRVVRKIDLWLIPIIACGYMFNSLDRSNLGNAKTDGLFDDIRGSPKNGNGYTTVVTVFTVLYSLFAPIMMPLTRRFGAHVTMPSFILAWGIAAAATAAVKTYAQLMVVRILLGLAEAAYSPSIIWYFTTFYTRGELAGRISGYYCCLALSGAFGGLIAYGTFGIERGTLYGWQYLFIIEGVVTIAIALCTFFVLPKSPATARFLTPREREVARVRLLRDASEQTDTALTWTVFFAPVLEPRFYVLGIVALCYGTASSLASNFLSIIIARFGLSTVETNLYTVAPNFLSALFMLASAYISDRFRQRALVMVSALTMTMVGCIVLACVPTTAIGVGYFACFLIAGGAFTPVVMFHSWHQNNDVSENSRAFRVAFYTLMANLGGVISAQIMQSKYAPSYRIPLIITACLEALAITLVLAVRTYFAFQNKKRNREQDVNWTSVDVPTQLLVGGADDPRFRYFL